MSKYVCISHDCAALALVDNLRMGVWNVFFSGVLDHLKNDGGMYWRAVLVGFAH